MQHVDPSLFSNVVAAVQRTNSLPGGAVRGLPGGMVIEGLQGASAFGSDIAEAKKELELGRVHAALARVRQVEAQFSGMAGRWSGNVSSIISSTQQGKQKLPLQKLNEAKNAQAKMQQLLGPATKAFRDLTSALDQAVASMGHTAEEENESIQTGEAIDGHDGDEAPPTDSTKSGKPDFEKARRHTGHRFARHRLAGQLCNQLSIRPKARSSPRFRWKKTSRTENHARQVLFPKRLRPTTRCSDSRGPAASCLSLRCRSIERSLDRRG